MSLQLAGRHIGNEPWSMLMYNQQRALTLNREEIDANARIQGLQMWYVSPPPRKVPLTDKEKKKLADEKIAQKQKEVDAKAAVLCRNYRFVRTRVSNSCAS